MFSPSLPGSGGCSAISGTTVLHRLRRLQKSRCGRDVDVHGLQFRPPVDVVRGWLLVLLSRAPNAAALFVAYLHSKEGQKWMWKQNGLDLPLYPESVMRKRLLAAQDAGAKIVMNSPQWLGSQGGYAKYRKSLQKILKAKRKKKK